MLPWLQWYAINMYSHYPDQLLDLQTIAVQTFLTIWWLKYLNRTIAIITMSIEFLFIFLFVVIAAAVNTEPGKKYYAAPVPVSLS